MYQIQRTIKFQSVLNVAKFTRRALQSYSYTAWGKTAIPKEAGYKPKEAGYKFDQNLCRPRKATSILIIVGI